jgi:hypothetical protein
VYPTRFEGMGPSVVEAIACGLRRAEAVEGCAAQGGAPGVAPSRGRLRGLALSPALNKEVAASQAAAAAGTAVRRQVENIQRPGESTVDCRGPQRAEFHSLGSEGAARMGWTAMCQAAWRFPRDISRQRRSLGKTSKNGLAL